MVHYKNPLLVLGTIPYDPPGWPNPSFDRRLDSAADLWRAGKVKYLIVSGNREGDGYDEPTAMRDRLIARGVPSNVIYRDFAGLRTVTSIVRARRRRSPCGRTTRTSATRGRPRWAGAAAS